MNTIDAKLLSQEGLGPATRRGGTVAFTLVELLVVIAVIALLAALLLPSLSRAKARADGIACISNLHQLGLGLLMYVEDFHAYPPQWAYHDKIDMNGEHIWEDTIGNWHVRLEPYVGAKWPDPFFHQPGVRPEGVYVCPGSLRLGRIPYTGTYAFNQSGLAVDIPPAPWGVSLDLGLGLGGIVLNRGHTTTGYNPTTETSVVAPADMLAIGDAAVEVFKSRRPAPWDVIFPAGDDDTLKDGYHENGGGVVDSPLYQRRHAARFNMVFCDGHTEALRLDQFWNKKRADVMARWNIDHQRHPNLPP